MFGKPEWFKPRKYTGWGLTPKTWQGWVYIAVILIPFIIFQSIPIWTDSVRLVVTFVWIGLLVLDTVPIMRKLGQDELEEQIEAKSERNAGITMAMILALGIAFELIYHALQNRVFINIPAMTALFAGLIVKALSYRHYEKKGLK